MNRRTKTFGASRFLLLPAASAALAVLAVDRSRSEAAVYVPEGMLWPGGIVPVEYDPSIDFFTRVRVEIAFDIWEQVANVTFIPRTDEEAYVYVRNTPGGGGSSSEVGRQDRQQFLNIRSELNDVSDYGLAHEVGHLLGFYHTHQRLDWDDYIDYYTERVNACATGNYDPAAGSFAYPRNEMDYVSVMSYGECIFATCRRVENTDCSCSDDTCNRYSFPGCSSDCCDREDITCCNEDPLNCRVLEIEDFGDRFLYQFEMGQREYLSEIDILVMSWMYPEPGTRFMELNYSPSDQTGTFHHPYVSVESALERAPSGILLLAQPATYPRPTSIMNKSMVIRAARGSVLIR